VKLLHLTAVGSDRPPATLDFAPRLTVVYGASETGKSYVIEALHFMLGASTLRDVPEANGYRTMLLGIEFDDGEVRTLARDLRGGRIAVYDEDIRIPPDRVPDRSLLARHQRGNSDTISHYLLEQLGIADAKLRKNQRNELQAMSFRNIAHLILVDEERMQARTSPVETGIVTARTAERSAFKLLLEGEDDSDLVKGEDRATFRRVNQGQVQVLNRAIEQVRTQLPDAPERTECIGLLARVNAAIQQTSASVAASLDQRDTMIQRRSHLQEQRQRAVQRSGDATALLNRFMLLDAQYATDLSRLEMVRQAGTLLGYFDADACVFCGAEAEHQQREHAVHETVQLAESIDAEAAKTTALKADLSLTLEAVQDELHRTQSLAARLGAEIANVTLAVDEVDRSLQPGQSDLDRFITRRSELERWIGLWARVSDLEELSASVAQQQPAAADPVSQGITSTTQREFTDALRSILVDWEVPDASDASFTFDGTPEIRVQHRKREDRGKGMRSVLHAAFTVALSEYCAKGELPHPGFVGLDTPVLTYRDADHAESEGNAENATGEELLSGSVATAFYDYLARRHSGQTIVLENQTPPALDAPGCNIVYFSGSSTIGRAGFYPAE
jgi:hypothetical protein